MAIWPLLKDMDRKDLFPATRSLRRTLGDHFGGIAGAKCQEQPIETAKQAAASARGIKRKAATHDDPAWSWRGSAGKQASGPRAHESAEKPVNFHCFPSRWR